MWPIRCILVVHNHFSKIACLVPKPLVSRNNYTRNNILNKDESNDLKNLQDLQQHDLKIYKVYMYYNDNTSTLDVLSKLFGDMQYIHNADETTLYMLHSLQAACSGSMPPQSGCPLDILHCVLL